MPLCHYSYHDTKPSNFLHTTATHKLPVKGNKTTILSYPLCFSIVLISHCSCSLPLEVFNTETHYPETSTVLEPLQNQQYRRCVGGGTRHKGCALAVMEGYHNFHNKLP